MKKVSFSFFITIAGIIFASCTRDSNILFAEGQNQSKSSQATDSTALAPTVQTPPADSTVVTPNFQTPSAEEENQPLADLSTDTIMVTINDIKSFNLTTSEIIFSNSALTDSLKNRIFGLSRKCIFFAGEKTLFITDVYSALASWRYDDLVFSTQNSQFHLTFGYPSDDILGANETASLQTRKENALKRKAEWETFIKYLSDAGKIIQ